MMTFSDFVQMLYPFCGEANSPSDFVTVLITNITEETEDEHCPLLDFKPEYLKRIYNGKKTISLQNATFVLSHLDKGKFSDYIRAFSIDTIECIADALRVSGIATDGTDMDVAEKCADLLAKIFSEIASRQLFDAHGTENDRENIPTPPAAVSPTVLDMLRRSMAHREKMLGDNGRFAYLRIDETLFPTARYFPSFVKGGAENKPRKLIDALRGDSGDILLVGEGGAGKTTSLLHVWAEPGDNAVPVYVPLNDYVPGSEFLRHYIPTNYGFAADAPDCDLLLLLDGYNEISGDPFPLIGELNELRLARHGRLRVILTSRHEYAMLNLPPDFDLYQLQPLEESVVTEYLKEAGIPTETAPLDVLKTPMMLSLYAQTCIFQKQAETHRDLLGVFEFRGTAARGDVVFNYLLCQTAKLILDRKPDELLITWVSLFHAAPYVAYKMERDGIFHISSEELPILIGEALSRQKDWTETMPAALRG